MTEVRTLAVGVSNGTTIDASILTIGSDVPVRVVLTEPYEFLSPPGWPTRPGYTGIGGQGVQPSGAIQAGTTISVLSCEANAIVAANVGTLA